MEPNDAFLDFVEHPPSPLRYLYYGGNGENCAFDRIYAVKCFAKKTYFCNCILDDCELVRCTLVNCILTSYTYGWTQYCEFKNCRIRGIGGKLFDLDGADISNCKIERGFNNQNRSLKDREPKDGFATQTGTFEVFSHCLLKEVVVDCLRHWAWRTKRRLRVPAIYGPPLSPEMQKARDGGADSGYSMGTLSDSDSPMVYTPSPSGSENNWGQLPPIRGGSHFKDATLPIKTVPVDYSNKDIITVWSAKKAGKRPFHVNDSYFVEQQLQMPLARTIMWDGTKAPKIPWKFAETYGGEMGSKEPVDEEMSAY